MLSGDLGRVAVVARTGGAAGLGDVGLEVGRGVSPMLAAGSPDVGAALTDTGTASVEWKLDGARIQVHRLDDDVRIYTRNLNEITSRLPRVADWARALPVRAVVLDGEAIGVDDEARPRVFQDTMSSFGRDAGVGAGARARSTRSSSMPCTSTVTTSSTERSATGSRSCRSSRATGACPAS